jgi:hypothetical protein
MTGKGHRIIYPITVAPKRPDRDAGRNLPGRQKLRANADRLKQVPILPIKPNTGLG